MCVNVKMKIPHKTDILLVNIVIVLKKKIGSHVYNYLVFWVNIHCNLNPYVNIKTRSHLLNQKE